MSEKNVIKKAVVLRSADSFGGVPDEVYSGRKGKKKKKKKQSKLLSPLEKSIRDVAKRQSRAATEYYDRHQKSNRKKKNGWIRDLNKNVNKSMSKLMGGSGLGSTKLLGLGSMKLF